MEHPQSPDYDRIAAAITYIREHFREQPDLDTIAEQVHLSPYHFQRLFHEWAGVTPKKFLQYISLDHARGLLRERAPLADAAEATGLSGTSRLHELFVNIVAMTPAEYRSGGQALEIACSQGLSPFGPLLVASTPRGICFAAFTDGEDRSMNALREQFPNASFVNRREAVHEQLFRAFGAPSDTLQPLRLHLKGTPFQLKVWEALLRIPFGRLSTYGDIAAGIAQPTASRAVGTAIGSNPVAFLIPCHRVIQASGAFGGYMWGPTRKTALIGWEAAQLEHTTS